MNKVQEVTEIAELTTFMKNRMRARISYREGALLYRTAKECTGKGVIVEIGSWKGASTIWLGKGSKAGSNLEVYAIDPHTEGNTFSEFTNNIKKANVSDIVVPIVKTSEEAEKDWNMPVEFLWIDGNHEYEYAKLDFDKWFPHLVVGGIIAFHDTIFYKNAGPKRVVTDNIYKSANFVNIRRVGRITYAQKVKSNTRIDRLKNQYLLHAQSIYEFLLAPVSKAARKYREHIPPRIWEVGKRILRYD